MLNLKDKIFYKKNGYILKKNFFTKNICKNILSIFLKYTDDEFSPVLNIDRFEFAIAYSIE